MFIFEGGYIVNLICAKDTYRAFTDYKDDKMKSTSK